MRDDDPSRHPGLDTTAPARSSTSTAGSSQGVGALSAEAQSAATGDIPDNQVFLTFTDPVARYSMSYPEGWTRNGDGRNVTFSDKNNIVHIVVAKAPTPTVAGVQSELAALQRKNSTLKFTPPRAATLKSGSAIKATYTTESAPNAVTGKRVRLMVDRYVLAHAGSGDNRSGHPHWRGQRRRLPNDQPQLQMAVRPRASTPSPNARQSEVRWPALEFRDVFRIYRSGPVETVALRGLDLQVQPREFVAVLGPSGCGKSTMLSLAAGLDVPSAGDVRAGRTLAGACWTSDRAGSAPEADRGRAAARQSVADAHALTRT